MLLGDGILKVIGGFAGAVSSMAESRARMTDNPELKSYCRELSEKQRNLQGRMNDYRTGEHHDEYYYDDDDDY